TRPRARRRSTSQTTRRPPLPRDSAERRGAGSRRGRAALPLKSDVRFGDAGRVDPLREDAAALREARKLVGAALLARGGHEHRAQVRAAERAHRRTARRQWVVAHVAAVRRQLDEPAVAVERREVMAAAVGRAAVGALVLAAPLRERARRARRARRAVVVERADPARGRVAVIHRAAIGTPREPVRDRHAAEETRQRAVAIEPIERRAIVVALLVHRADDESTPWIAAAVVEAILRGVVRCIDDAALEAARAVAKPDAAAQCDDEPTALAKRV